MKNKITINTESGVTIELSSNRENNEQNLNTILNQIIRLDTVMGDEGVCINRNEEKNYIQENELKEHLGVLCQDVCYKGYTMKMYYNEINNEYTGIFGNKESFGSEDQVTNEFFKLVESYN